MDSGRLARQQSGGGEFPRGGCACAGGQARGELTEGERRHDLSGGGGGAGSGGKAGEGDGVSGWELGGREEKSKRERAKESDKSVARRVGVRGVVRGAGQL
jgi:hypothetical protein